MNSSSSNQIDIPRNVYESNCFNMEHVNATHIMGSISCSRNVAEFVDAIMY